MNKTKNMIWVTFQKEGLHKYPAALTDPNLATGGADDVSFLGYIHRHIFKFKVSIEVFHEDRDLEFIQFKRWLESLYAGSMTLDYKSCEMISDDLYGAIEAKYPGREVWIEVSEDGENGSFSKYEPVKIMVDMNPIQVLEDIYFAKADSTSPKTTETL